MKKILSLFVVSLLVLSCFAMTAFAADFGYNIHNFTAGANAMNAEGIVPIFVRSIGSTLGGSITLKYDSTKVVPMVYSETEDVDTGETIISYEEATSSTKGAALVVAVKGSLPSDSAATFDFTNKTIKVDLYSAAGLTNNQQFIKVFFKDLNTSTDDWDCDTFKVIDGKVKNPDQVQANYGEMALTYTYTNADVIPGGGNVAATNVVLDKTAATINTIGETVTLTATVKGENDADATNQNVTWTTDKASVATVANGVVTAVADGTATITATSEDGSFTATCAITVDADWEAAPADKTEWKNGFEFKGQDGTTKTDNTVKKLVIFGKNSTTAELAAESYGVKIGINEYKGVLPVPAGSSWAIIILDENGQKVALDNYSYTAFVGDKTVFSGNVNAQ